MDVNNPVWHDMKADNPCRHWNCWFGFTKGDANDINYRRALVDTFIGKIWLYDDKITILYNVQDGKIEVPLGEINGSPKGKVVRVAL